MSLHCWLRPFHYNGNVPVGLAVGVQAKVLVVTTSSLLHDDRLLLIVRGGRLPFLVLLILVIGDDNQLLLRACLPSLTLDSYIVIFTHVSRTPLLIVYIGIQFLNFLLK